jgi:hypothetical protein
MSSNMAASFETPAQFERDLRSANHGFKRTKDSSAKWSYGARPLPGIGLDWDYEPVGGSEGQRSSTKARPRYKLSDT